MSSTMDEVRWTSHFLEQFAAEWLKYDILLPNPYTDGMSKYKVSERRSAAWRDMAAKLSVPPRRPLLKLYLKKYRRMLKATAIRVRARSAEDLLRAAPPWARSFDAHFRIADKVIAERQGRIKVVPLNKRELLSNVLLAMWGAVRGEGGAGGGGREGAEVLAGAVSAAAEKCGFPAEHVEQIWRNARAVAMTKLRLLQRLGDRRARRPGAADLAPADWIAADLTLLHDDTERLLTEETLKDSDQTSTLTSLLSLVQHCELGEWALAGGEGGALAAGGEGDAGRMRERWERAAHAYSYSGRVSSMVVLQRRWLELVVGTRARLAARRARRASPAPPARPAHAPLSPVCTQLAKRFPSLLTARVASWRELVRSGRVFVQDHTAPPPAVPLPPPTFSFDDYSDPNVDDDIILIERDIETVDLADLDSADETDKLIISEKLKMERLLPTQRETVKEEQKDEQQKVLEKRKQDMCDNLDNELDSTLKDIIKQNEGSEPRSVTSSVNWSLFNNKNVDGKNEPKDSTNIKIDLTEESLDGTAPSVNVSAGSLPTGIDLVDEGSEQGNLNRDTANLTQETANKSSVMAYTQHGKGNINQEIIESVLKELNASTSPQKATISLFEQLDPSTMEAKIIFSDDDDDCNVNEPLDHANVSRQSSVENIERNSKQDQLNNEKSYIKIEEHDLKLNKPARDVNINKLQEDCIINLDTDDSDSETNSNETVKMPIKRAEDVDKSTKAISDKSKLTSPTMKSFEPEQNIYNKPKIGPKSFKERCNKYGPKSPNKEHVETNQEIIKKQRIGPKSFMDSLKRRKCLVSDQNDASVKGSVKNTQINASETEPVSPIVADQPTIIISDHNSKNIMKVSCKIEVSSEDETIIPEKQFSSKLSFEEELHENDEKDDIESKSAVRKHILNKSEFDIPVDNSNLKIKSEPDEVIEKTETTEILQGSKCKLSFEPGDAQISKSNNDTVPAAMEVDEPVVNTDADKNTNNASITVHESENSNDSNDISDHSYVKNKSTGEDAKTNDLANNNNDLPSNCKSEKDETANEGNIHLGQLLMAAQIRLCRIDELAEWTRVKRGTIDVKWMKVDGSGGVKRSSRRLKPGLRPSGWGERRRADHQTSGAQGRDTLNPIVRLTRLPIQVVHGYLVKQQCRSPCADADAEGGGRARKRVELADIEEVRRANRRLRTAQVKPIAQVSESGGASDSDSGAAGEGVAADADNTLTPEELDEVLRKLQQPAAAPSASAPAPPPKYCCLARRHINYNRARARLAARAGKQSTPREMHAVNSAHAQLRCSCCCLAALQAEAQCATRLAADQRALDAALKLLVVKPRVNAPARKQLKPKRKSGNSAAAASAPPPPPPPPAAPASSEESEDDLPLIIQKRANNKASLTKQQTANRRKRIREAKRKEREEKEREQAEEERATNEYDEYMRQRNLVAKYFTINPSSSTASSRPKNSITVRPRVPDSTPKKDTKEKTLTKEMIDLHEQSLDVDNVPTPNEEVIQSNKTSNTETDKCEVNAHADSQAPETPTDLTGNEQNQNGTVINIKNIISDHDYVGKSAIEPDKDVQNSPAPAINPSPPIRIVRGDPPASEETEMSQNQQKIDKNINKPSLPLANLFRMAKWQTNKNIKIVPFKDYQQQTAQEPQVKNMKKDISNFPQLTILPIVHQQSNTLKSPETVSRPKQPINQPADVTGNQPQPPVNVEQPNALKSPETTKSNQPVTVKANQPQQPTGLQKPTLFNSPETNRQPKQQICQPMIVTTNQVQPPASQLQPITIEPIETINHTNQLMYCPAQIATNQSQLEPETVKEINATDPTNDPEQEKVTKLSGMSSETIKVWKYSNNKVLLNTLIKTSHATPGLKVMRVLHSPKPGEMVLAVCQAKPENPNLLDLHMIPQSINNLEVNPNLNTQPSIGALYQTEINTIQLGNETDLSLQTEQKKTLLQNPANAAASSEVSDMQLNLNIFPNQNMPSTSSGGTQVDTNDSGNMSKLNVKQSPALKTPESDSDDIQISSILTKNKDEFTDSATIYVDDLVKYLNKKKMPLDDVKILGRFDNQNMLKILGRYIILNNVHDDTVRNSKQRLTFWTLKPRLQLSQILFSKMFKSRKRKLEGERTSESSDGKVDKEGGSGEQPKLRVRDFAKLPLEVVEEAKEGVMMMTASARAEPPDLFVEGHWFTRLSETPLVYGQVLTAVESARAAGSLLATPAQLHLLDLRGTSQPWPIHKCSKIVNGKMRIDLFCAHAEDAMQELQRLLRKLKSFSSQGEATITCHYIGRADPNSVPSQIEGSHNVPPHLIDSNIVPPHTVGSNIVLPYTAGSNIVPPCNAGSNVVPPCTAGSNSVPSHTIVSNNVPLNTFGSSSVPKNVVGSNIIPPNVMGSNIISPNVMGSNIIPANVMESNIISPNVMGSNIIPQNVGLNSSLSHTVVSNNTPSNVMSPNNLPPHFVDTNTISLNVLSPNNVHLNILSPNNVPLNVLSPNNVPPHSVVATNVVGFSSIPEDTGTSGRVLFRLVNAGGVSAQAGVSPGILQAAAVPGSAAASSNMDGNGVILLESDDDT